MHWEPELKKGRADKCVSTLIDLQDSVAKTQKNHWTGVNDEKKKRKVLKFKVLKEAHAWACKCGMIVEKPKGI